MNTTMIRQLLEKIKNAPSILSARAYADAALMSIETAETCDLFLESFDSEKLVSVVKALRNEFGLGLAESKNLIESAPIKLKTLSKTDANRISALLTGAGAKVSLR